MESNWKTYYNFDRYRIYDNGDIYDCLLKKIISQQTNRDGYKVVTLRDNNGCRKTLRVHRLVAECFVENTYNKETVNHEDGIKANNHFSNLSWMTRSENIQHAWDMGLIKDMEARKAGIRSKQGIPVICITTGVIYSSAGEAAELLGLKQTNINAVCRRKKGFKSAGKTIDGTPMIWRYAHEQ